jgi:23S rRNA pseudouridine1911/1915/1917 synthase
MNFDFEHKVKKEDSELLIKGLLKRERGVSTRLMRRMRYGDGGIFLNGNPAKLIDHIKEGDWVQVRFPVERSEFEPEDIPIDVVYEDDSILAVNKQPGFVVHPTKGHPNHTLANGIMKYMLDKGENYKIRFVNRLDMNTSGLFLVGKNPHVQHHFTTQADRGQIGKKYTALVCGIMESNRGVIDLPIGKEDEDKVKRIVREDGSPSITEYEVLERFKSGYTLVKLNLITGRTHQIRVHLSHLRHPVVGDELYGGAKPWLIDRQTLHATSLSFSHPITGKKITLKAPLPEDINKVLVAISAKK